MPGEVVPVVPAAAPAQATTPTGNASGAVQTPGAEQAKPSDLMTELGVVLKKHGGLKIKSGGKEVGIDDPQLLVRRFQNVDGLEASANELLKLRSETKADRELRERLKGEKNPRERVKILRQMHGEEFDDAAEAATLERFERARAKDKLTPNERKLQDELDHERGAREKAEARQRELDAQQERTQLEAATKQLRTQLFGITATALQKVGVNPEHADRYIPEVAAYLGRAAQLGLEVNPEEVAAFVTEKREGENISWLGSLSDEALLDKLEKMAEQSQDGRQGPSRAKRLANLMAKRALERVNQAPSTGTTPIIPNGQQQSQQQRQANGGEKPASYWKTWPR